eukprot:CAMPEP_0174754480 /NCGR_PEP_ID=MMETSP1094-20130205/105759_1 /TAXON_ID=156173 /ORGANISM="Chrysochromulina brevifilum, Strain UTEX LB 985" /LENGTH=639 /DNA_ID=CAMNT_0015960351 /DNA_START=99 /DNA_END=2019 /DNA_ORIENTATION=-
MPLQFAAPPVSKKSPLGSRGPYQKLKPIGKGAFGTVFLVSKPNVPDNLVLKEVGLKGLNVIERKQTMNEVAILKKLTHPNIIAFHESITVDQTLCVIMEYASGGDLAGLIATQKKSGKRLPEAEILRMAAEIMSAISYCHHELHLLHRDLKPQNIFLGKDGEVKLGDFGISKVLGASKAMAQTQCGTPLYMAPEICRGARYDRGADVWAIGCVLYEMMSLTPPWVDKVAGAAGGIRALMRVITTSQLNLAPLRSHYSTELCTILASLISKSSADRPALLDLLAKPLLHSALPRPPTPPSSAADGQLAPVSTARYRNGSILLVRRTSGLETMAVVDKMDAISGMYSLSLVSKDGKLEGTKLAPEPDLREPSSPHEKQMMAAAATVVLKLRQQQHAAAAGQAMLGGIEEHAAAQVLQSVFKQKRAAAAPAAAAASPVGIPPPPTAGRYRNGSIVLVRRTSGLETMAVVDKMDAISGMYSLSLVSKDGKLEGTKLAPEPDLREPSSPMEKQMELQQRGRLSQQRARTPRTPIDKHAAAEVLQRSFQKRRAERKPMTPIAENAPLNALLQRPPVFVKHHAIARNGVGQPQLGGQQARRPETLEQQQRRLAANAEGAALEVTSALRVPVLRFGRFSEVKGHERA